MVDGTLIPRNPMQLVESGKFARVSCVSLFWHELEPQLCNTGTFHNWRLRGWGNVSTSFRNSSAGQLPLFTVFSLSQTRI
jgi:hypothetical protein